MRSSLPAVTVLLLGISLGALLGGCGSSTKTVSVAGTPSVPAGTRPGASTATQTSAARAPASTAPASTTGAPRPTTTRTAPEPAFTEGEAGAEGLSAATAVLREQGFTPTDTSVYRQNQALRVLIGTRTGSTDAEQAFFFVNGRYIGTDSKLPSATVSVVSQGDTEVTLGYELYRGGDPLGSPSGGVARVTFQLDNGMLTPLQAIPPVSSENGLGRR